MDEIVLRLARLGTKVVAIRTDRPDLTDDNLYPQTQRTADGLIGLLEQYGFRVIDHAYLIELLFRDYAGERPIVVLHVAYGPAGVGKQSRKVP